VLVLALLLGLGGGAFAVAYFGKKDGGSSEATDPGGGSAGSETTAGSAVAAGSATRPIAPPDAQVTPIDGATPANVGSAGSAAMAVILIDSTPPGADVVDADKKSYGKTPAKLTLPISDLPLTFELRLAGYRKKTKEIVVSGNTMVQVTLDKLPVQTPHKGSGRGSGNGGGDELMRPDDL
jgi:hypothetical protein